MKTQLYKKIIIRSEDDLPKENGEYFTQERYSEVSQYEKDVIYEKHEISCQVFNGSYKNYWLNNVDWYLLPTEIKFPSEEEINKLAKDRYRESNNAAIKINAFADGIDYAINWIKETNNLTIKEDENRTE